MPERIRCCGWIVAALFFLLCPVVVEAETDLGGDFRFYPFLFLEDTPSDRSDVELAVLRGKLTADLSRSLRVEAHAVLEMSSPLVATPTTFVVAGATRRYFDLDHTVQDGHDVRAVASMDRLNLRWEKPSFRLTAGRQAVTWGVNYFWPVLDLFAPFAPERVDREYKPGVDAARLVVPVGTFSEVELITAMQGDRPSEDFSVASLGRFHRGSTDFGYMLGRFHGDDVLGVFVVADISGTALRIEVAHTSSDERVPTGDGYEQFWRASLGFDRQVSPRSTFSAEAHWNGFGANDPQGYLEVAQADRVRRGEVTSLGRLYSGVSMSWQVHPLRTLSAAVLTNWDDGSTLLQPTLTWSLSNNSALLVGVIAGIGPGSPSASVAKGEPLVLTAIESEYGLVPLTIWGSYSLYF